VTEFSAGAETTAKQRVVGHDSAAHPCANGQSDHVGVGAAGTKPKLGPTGGIGIVLDNDRQIEPGFELVPERLITPADVRRVVHGRLGGVDEPGSGDPRRYDVLALGKPQNHGDDGIFDFPRVSRGGRLPIRADDGARLVDESTGNFGAPDIDTNCVHGAPFVAGDREVVWRHRVTGHGTL